MKIIWKAIVGVAVLTSALIGCGSGESEVVLTEDPQEMERLKHMMPPHMRGEEPAQPPTTEEAAPQPLPEDAP